MSTKPMSEHTITHDQIAKAWEHHDQFDTMSVAIFAELNIHRCEGCGGSGRVESRSSSMREDPMVWRCSDCAEWGSKGFMVKSC